jgi:hypothetical protein
VSQRQRSVARLSIKVENELVRSGRFRLPSKRRLLETEIGMSAALVDVTEVTILRPKKNNVTITAGNRGDTH